MATNIKSSGEGDKLKDMLEDTREQIRDTPYGDIINECINGIIERIDSEDL